MGSHSKLKGTRLTHTEFDVLNPPVLEAEQIVLAASYTDVSKAETEKQECFDINVKGVLNVLEAYPDTPIIYISSEYAAKPVNFYSLTKSLAEQLIILRGNYLIIRTLFKPFPWPYDYAFTDQFTLGGYVTDVAPRIDKAIEEWDKQNSLIYIGDGQGRKTMFELAKRTKHDVKENSIKDMKVKLPHDYIG